MQTKQNKKKTIKLVTFEFQPILSLLNFDQYLEILALFRLKKWLCRCVIMKYHKIGELIVVECYCSKIPHTGVMAIKNILAQH